MKEKWQKYKRLIKNVVIFCVGNLVLSSAVAIVLYEFLGDVLEQVSREELEEVLKHPFGEIARSASRLYIITYILFNYLPQKIRKSPYWLRGIYFTLFYLFCILIYLWI